VPPPDRGELVTESPAPFGSGACVTAAAGIARGRVATPWSSLQPTDNPTNDSPINDSPTNDDPTNDDPTNDDPALDANAKTVIMPIM
jgi:hypothetical protein